MVKIFPNGLTITKWTLLKGGLLVGLLIVTFVAGAMWTVPTAYKQGYEEGVVNTLEDVKAKLQTADIDFDWQYLGEGKYLLEIKAASTGETIVTLTPEIDLSVKHYRNGVLIDESYGAGTLTTFGKNWIEIKISGAVNTTDPKALYLGDSNDATAPDVAWVELPNEIAANGLDRQLGEYVSTGDGAWNVSKTKAVSGTQSTQLWGLYGDVYSTETLIAADSTPDQKNCVSGDTLTEVWQVTVS